MLTTKDTEETAYIIYLHGIDVLGDVNDPQQPDHRQTVEEDDRVRLGLGPLCLPLKNQFLQQETHTALDDQEGVEPALGLPEEVRLAGARQQADEVLQQKEKEDADLGVSDPGVRNCQTVLVGERGAAHEGGRAEVEAGRVLRDPPGDLPEVQRGLEAVQQHRQEDHADEDGAPHLIDR